MLTLPLKKYRTLIAKSFGPQFIRQFRLGISDCKHVVEDLGLLLEEPSWYSEQAFFHLRLAWSDSHWKTAISSVAYLENN